jgi:hypothetical protein
MALMEVVMTAVAASMVVLPGLGMGLLDSLKKNYYHDFILSGFQGFYGKFKLGPNINDR